MLRRSVSLVWQNHRLSILSDLIRHGIELIAANHLDSLDKTGLNERICNLTRSFQGQVPAKRHPCKPEDMIICRSDVT